MEKDEIENDEDAQAIVQKSPFLQSAEVFTTLAELGECADARNENELVVYYQNLIEQAREWQ